MPVKTRSQGPSVPWSETPRDSGGGRKRDHGNEVDGFLGNSKSFNSNKPHQISPWCMFYDKSQKLEVIVSTIFELEFEVP